MKKPATLVMAMLMALFIAACGGGGSVIGKWLHETDGEGLSITFYEDGRAVLSDDGDRTNGTYAGKSLKLYGFDRGLEELTFKIEIKGNLLILTATNPMLDEKLRKLIFIKSGDGGRSGGGRSSGGILGGGGKSGFINECIERDNAKSYCERSWDICVAERGASFCGNPDNW